MASDSSKLNFETVSDSAFVRLEGRIGSSPEPASGGGPSNSSSSFSSTMPSTLDEPVSVTIFRDLKAVIEKLKHVFIPTRSRILLKEWDLWGPLFLCTILSILLHDSTADSSTESGPEFAEIFLVYWLGAAMCTLNFKLVGAPVSFFQSLCVLGYCTLPHLGAAFICKIILLTTNNAVPMLFLRLLSAFAASAWATYASTAFLSSYMPSDRRMLCIYPLFLFYAVLGWLIMSHNPYSVAHGSRK